ncbi:DUF4333 domain-containing protein [Rhodococcus triatomae]|nr:hypothetical protein G419_06702 [Rhodococcus triatomae BKS 15-14]
MSDGTTGPEGGADQAENPTAPESPAVQPDPAAQQGVPQATSAFPEQAQPQPWGQQAWSDQPVQPQQYPAGPQYGAPQQYPTGPQYGAPQQYGTAPHHGAQQYGAPQQDQYPPNPQQMPPGVPGQYPHAQPYPGYPQGQAPQQAAFAQPYAAYGQPYPGQPQPGQYPQAYGQYPAGAYPNQFPADTPATSKKPLWIGLGAVALAAVVGIGLAVSGVFGPKTLDSTAAEEGVTKIVTGYGYTDVADVDCPSGREIVVDATVTCTLTINGEPNEVELTIMDDDARYEVSHPSPR